MVRSFELPNWSNAPKPTPKKDYYTYKSREWAGALAQILFQVDQAALEYFPRDEPLGDQAENFKAWAESIEEKSRRDPPVASEEVWSYVVEFHRLWIWRRVFNTLASQDGTQLLQFNKTQAIASIFIQSGRQLAETAYQFDRTDTGVLSDVFIVVQLQLRNLDNFSLIYSRKWGEALDRDVTHSWGYNLQQRVYESQKAIETQEAQGNRPLRSPPQRLQDNTVLQTVVVLVFLSCIYPLVLSMQHSPSTAGSVTDPDFWSQIISSVVGLAGFFTLLLPIYRETVAKEWIGTWILTALGSVSAIIAVAIYPTVSVSGALFCSYLTASCQLFVLLQVSLIAAFHRTEHAKVD